jgi:hypothetical protein
MGMTTYPAAAMNQPSNKHNVIVRNEGNLLRDTNDSVSTPVSFCIPHLLWHYAIDDHKPLSPAHVNIVALIDHGSPAVLIDECLVSNLHLHQR